MIRRAVLTLRSAWWSTVYTDLILGSIARNFGGVPSGDNLWLYCGNFFCKEVAVGFIVSRKETPFWNVLYGTVVLNWSLYRWNSVNGLIDYENYEIDWGTI